MRGAWDLSSEVVQKNFLAHVGQLRLAGKKPLFQQVEEKRSLPQNALINTLYGQIASQSEDLSVLDIRRACKLNYGAPILAAHDRAFAALWADIEERFDYEFRLTLMTYMDITSRKEFKKPLATEYIDTIIREYSKQGYSLIHPSEQR